jgi:hypothetical protein
MLLEKFQWNFLREHNMSLFFSNFSISSFWKVARKDNIASYMFECGSHSCRLILFAIRIISNTVFGTGLPDLAALECGIAACEGSPAIYRENMKLRCRCSVSSATGQTTPEKRTAGSSGRLPLTRRRERRQISTCTNFRAVKLHWNVSDILSSSVLPLVWELSAHVRLISDWKPK